MGFLGGLGCRKQPIKLIKDFLNSGLCNNTTLAMFGDGPLGRKVGEFFMGYMSGTWALLLSRALLEYMFL